MPDLSVRGPFRERHLGDQVWAHPVYLAGQSATRRRGEGRLALLERLQLLAQLARRGLRKAGPYLARVCELAGIVYADQKRADAGARPCRVGEPADHDLLSLDAFRLLPACAASGLVGEVAAFRHDPFRALPARFGEDARAVTDDMVGILQHAIRASEQSLQARLAFLERQAADIGAIQVQQIEDEVRQAAAGGRAGGPTL